VKSPASDLPNRGQVITGKFLISKNLVQLAKSKSRYDHAAREMSMPPIKSRAITFAEYDENSRELSITFKQGNTYTYYGVPPSIYAGFISADSAGSYFNARIKDNYSAR
jgi:hypothetical protein